MTTKIINGITLKLYDSIEELPILNFQKFNRYLLIDAGIGSDLEDIDVHIEKVAKYINTDKQLAVQELMNMRQSLYFISQAVDVKHLAFVTLIYEINGKKLYDLSDDNVKAISTKLNLVKRNILVDLLMFLKKKLNSELELYFPSIFSNSMEKEAYDLVRRKAMFILDSIIKDENETDSIEAIDAELFSYIKPKIFSGNKSAELVYIKEFEQACAIIAKFLKIEPKKLTVFEFYNSLEIIKKQQPTKVKRK